MREEDPLHGRKGRDRAEAPSRDPRAAFAGAVGFCGAARANRRLCAHGNTKRLSRTAACMHMVMERSSIVSRLDAPGHVSRLLLPTVTTPFSTLPPFERSGSSPFWLPPRDAGPSRRRFWCRREWPAQHFRCHTLTYRAVDMTMPDQIVGEILRRDTAESLDPVVEANLCGSGRAYVDEPRIFP